MGRVSSDLPLPLPIFIFKQTSLSLSPFSRSSPSLPSPPTKLSLSTLSPSSTQTKPEKRRSSPSSFPVVGQRRRRRRRREEAHPRPFPLAKAKAIGHARNHSSLDSEGISIRGAKTGPTSSDTHMARNVSCPVSPIGSPLLYSRSPQHMNGRMSPSPISSPRTASGASTPLTGGNGAIPFHHLKPPSYMHEGFGSMPRSPNSHLVNGSTYHEPKADLFRGMQSGSHAFLELMTTENDVLGKPFGRPAHGDPRELYDGQSVLADRVSQQFFRDHVKLNPSLDLKSGSPMLGHYV